MKFLAWWLRKVAGDDLARDIEGDIAESGGGPWRLAAVAASLTTRRISELRPGLAGAVADVRYAVRALRRSPWYAVTTIGVIALSMALAITVFAVVDGVLFKPLPYLRVSELMSVEASRGAVTGGSFSVSSSEVTAWQAAVPEAAFATFEFGNSYDIDDGEPAHFTEVSANFFDVLGLRPLIGGFHERGERAQGLVTYSMWRRRLGADPAVVGRILQLDHAKPVEIVGVLPPEFVFPMARGRFVPDVVQLAGPVKDPANNRERSFKVLARVPAGIPATLMQQRLHAATLSLATRFPGTPGKAYTRPFDVTTVTPLDTALRAEARDTFTLVFVAAAALVLLACLNVTGLAAARAQDRRHELSLRRALGGRGSDLVRLLGAESVVVVGAGATLGLGMAALLMRVTATLLPNSLVLFRSLAIDIRVVLFAALAAALSVTITTVWPARVTLRRALQPALTASSRSVARGRGVSRFLLIGTQVGIALVMTVVGALVAGSLVRLWREDPGYRVANTMALTLSDPEQVNADLNQQVILAIQHTPGVIAAGGSNQFLLQRALRGSMFEAPPNALKTGEVESTAVTSGFFETTAIAPVAGRIPTAEEFASGEHVAVVSQIVAHAYWPDRSAVGQTLIREGRGVAYTVIGVVPDARYIAFDREPDGNIYYPRGRRAVALDRFCDARSQTAERSISGSVAHVIAFSDVPHSERAASV